MVNNKPIVLQQALNPVGGGGVSVEFRALQNSSLKDKYQFSPAVLIGSQGGFSLKDIAFYMKIIKEIQPDIIQVRGAAIDGLNAVIAAKLVGKCKIMVCVHGMYSDLVYINRLKKWICKHIVERLIFSLSDGISCVCHAADIRSYFAKYKRKGKMLPFVYNRIPDYSSLNTEKARSYIRENLNLTQNAVIGIFCGRVTKEKGMSILLEALTKLDANWPEDFKMLIVGNGDYLSKFTQGCKTLKNSTSIICVGEQSDVPSYLLASDFFVMPSLHENHSIALLEACAAKLPIISTNVGGNAEIVYHKRNGVLIDKNCPNELCSEIRNMISNTEFRKDTALFYEENPFEEFQAEHVDSQLDQAYKILLK